VTSSGDVGHLGDVFGRCGSSRWRHQWPVGHLGDGIRRCGFATPCRHASRSAVSWVTQKTREAVSETPMEVLHYTTMEMLLHTETRAWKCSVRFIISTDLLHWIDDKMWNKVIIHNHLKSKIITWNQNQCTKCFAAHETVIGQPENFLRSSVVSDHFLHFWLLLAARGAATDFWGGGGTGPTNLPPK